MLEITFFKWVKNNYITPENAKQKHLGILCLCKTMGSSSLTISVQRLPGSLLSCHSLLPEEMTMENSLMWEEKKKS